MKTFVIGIVCFVVVMSAWGIVFANGTTSMMLPLDNYIVNCNIFWSTCNGAYHLGEDAYASVGDVVYSAADGIVVHAKYHAPTKDAVTGEIRKNYGGMVMIEHSLLNGEKFVTIYGHLGKDQGTDILVLSGQTVKKGQPIGRIGPIEENGNYPVHLHYGIHKGAYAEGTSCDGHWKYAGYDYSGCSKNDWYDPMNFTIYIRQIIPHNGQLTTNVFGPQIGSIRWYRNPPTNPIAGEIITTGDDKGMSKNVYVQHYDKEICGTDSNTNYYGSIVYDTLGGARSAYIVGWQQRCGWIGTDKVRRGGWELSGGPDSVNLRNPITNSYWYPRGTLNYPNGCWRQDFQMGWLCYEKRYGYDKDDRGNTLNSVAPGVYDPWGRIFSDVRRWDATTSYAFAEAYERNGAAVNLGSTYDDGGTVFVHNWTINSLTIIVQNFSGGSFGPSAIIYNPSNGNAYNIRTGFWEYYKNNSGPSLLGPPKEDEHGNSAAQPCAYISCQRFERGELYWNGSSVVAYIPDPNASGGYGTIGVPSPDPIAPAAPGGLKVQ